MRQIQTPSANKIANSLWTSAQITLICTIYFIPLILLIYAARAHLDENSASLIEWLTR